MDNMSVDSTAEIDNSVKQRSTTRRLANNAPEAKVHIRALHSRVPAWKVSKCIEVLNAPHIDLAHIAEVIEIQLASSDLVAVAAKLLAELLISQTARRQCSS